jgi:hypothetical protein
MVVEAPEQRLVAPVNTTAGGLFTLILIAESIVQPESFTASVYVVVTAGLTTKISVSFTPLGGPYQKY